MPDQVQLRGGSAADNNAFTGANREVTVDTTNKTLRVHDGVAAGGHPLIQGTASTAADADTVAKRDAWGRLQVADPVDAADATSKSYVDGAVAGSVALVRAERTAGNLTLNSTAWANVDTDLDLVVSAAAGDVIEVSINALWGAHAVNGYLDVATIVAGSVVNYIGTDGGGSDQGLTGWRGISGAAPGIGGSVQYVVQAGDIEGGDVTLRLRYRTATSENKVLTADAVAPLKWSVIRFAQ